MNKVMGRTCRRVVVKSRIVPIVALCAAVGSAQAAINWDPLSGNGIIDGGAGIWDLSTPNWTTNGGTSNILWDNVLLDTAIFGGTGGAVSLGTAITAGGLTFDVAGYSVSGNTLTLGGGAPTITANADAAISSIVAGTAGFTKSGAGTSTLSGANTYSGPTLVTNGTLQIGATGGNGTLTATTSTYDISSGATLRYVRNNLTSATSGATSTAIGWARMTGAGTIALSSGQAVNGTAFWGSTALGAGFTGKLVVDNGRIDTNTNGALAVGSLGGVTSIEIKSGAQFLIFGTATSIYNIPITITGSGFGEAGQNNGALRLAGGNTATWQGNVTLAGNAGIYAQDGGSNFTITGSISGAFEADLFSNGTLTVTPASGVQNAYTSTKISGTGAVVAGNQFAFSTGLLTMNGATLRLNGFDFTFANISGTGTVSNNSATASVITVGSDNASTTYAGSFTNGGAGSLGLTKVGTGTLTLTAAANSLTGTTTVSAGTVQFGDGTTGKDAVPISSQIVNNGSVIFNLFGAPTYAASMSGTGSVVKSGPGTLALTGVNTYSGTTTISSGILFPTSPVSLPGYDSAGKISVGDAGIIRLRIGAGFWTTGELATLAQNATFTGGSMIGYDTTAGSLTYTTLAGNAGVAKFGGNTLTINSQQTYTGGTGAFGGTLALDFSSLGANPSNIVSPTSKLSFGGGTLNVIGKAGANASNQTFASLIVAGSGPSAITLTNAGTSVGLTITDSAFTRIAGSTLSFNIPAGGAVNWSPALTNGIIGSWALVNAGGTTRYATSTAGTITGFTGTAAADASALTDTTGTVNYELAAGGTAPVSSVVNTVRYTGPEGTITSPLSSNGIIQAGTGPLLLTGAQVIGASRELIISGPGNMTSTGIISNNAGGSSSLIYNGTGVLTLNAANTFNGPLVINSGVVNNTRALAASATAQSMGTSGQIVLNGGTFRHSGGDYNVLNGFVPTITVGPNGGAIDLTGGFVFYGGAFTGSGTLRVLNSTNTSSKWILYTGTSPAFAGSIEIGDGTGTQAGIQIRSASVSPLGTVPITINKGGILTADSTGANSSNPITLNGGTIGTQNNSVIYNGTIQVAADSTVATPELLAVNGLITFNGLISGSANLKKTTGNTALFTASNPFSGRLDVVGGTVRLGNTSAFPNANLVLGGGTLAFDSSVVSHEFTVPNLKGFGTVSLQDNAAVPNPVHLIVGDATPFAQFAGTVSGPGALTKVGTGTLVLSSANTYAGQTIINGGTLLMSSSSAANLVTVGAGAGFGTTGTGITIASLALESASTLYLPALISGASLTVTDPNSTVTLGGTSSVSIRVGGIIPGAGVYTLLDYEGVLFGPGGFDAFTLASIPTRTSATIQENVGAGTIELNVASTDTVKWTGANGTAWAASPVQNWQLNTAGTATNYLAGDNVSFTDGAAQLAVDISSGNVAPSTVTFTNAIDAYTVAGSNGITGSTGVTKTGAATVTIGTLNSFTGPVIVSEGTLSINSIANGGTNSALGAGSVVNVGGIATPGALQYSGPTATTNRTLTLGTAGGTINVSNAATNLTWNSQITGGPLTKSGPGTLTMGSMFNSFTGVLTVTGGLVSGELANNSTTNSSFGAGTGFLLDGGGIQLSGANSGTAYNRTITLGPAGGTIDVVQTGVSFGFTPVISGTGSLTKSGAGIMTLGSVANTFSGGVVIKGGILTGGTLTVAGTNSAFGTGGITFDGGTLRYTGAAAGSDGAPINRAITVTAAGGTLDNISSGAGIFYSGVVTGSGPLTVASSGTIRQWFLLGNSPDFHGNLIIGGTGSVQIRGNAAIGTQVLGSTTGDTTVNTGGVLSADNGNVTLNLSIAENIKLNGGFFGMENGANSTLTSTGTISILTVGSSIGHKGGGTNGFLNINGPIVGSQPLTITNQGTAGTPETSTVGYVRIGNTTGNSFSGPITIVRERLELANSGGNAFASTIYNIGIATAASRGVVILNASNQIADDATLNFLNTGTDTGFLILNGNSDAVGGLVNTTGRAIVEATESGSSVVSTLTLAGTGTYAYAGAIRNSNTGTANSLALVKTGAGTQTLSGTGITYSGGTSVSNGTLRFVDTTTLNAAPMAIASPGTLEFSRTGTDYTVASPINGASGSLSIVAGAGTITLSGVGGTFAGLTTVTSGRLMLTGSLAGSSTLVKSGATLAGTGAAGVTTFESSAILAPGTAGPGTLVVGGLIFSGGTLLNFELNSSNLTPGSTFNDLVTVGGNLTLDGTLNVTELGSGGFAAAAFGTKWRLFDYIGSLTDSGITFGTMPVLTSGLSYEIDTTTIGQVNLAVVPEPTAGLALLGGLGVVIGMRRRRS